MRNLFTIFILLACTAAKAQDCSILEPWLTQGHPQLPQSSTYEDRANAAQQEYILRVSTSESLHQLYESGKLDQTQLNNCLSSLPDRENFLETFYYALFSGSLTRLDSAKSPAIQTLMKIFHDKYGSGIPIFRVMGSFGEQDPTMFPAGVQRGTDSMYINFAQIDPNDWLITFVHETLHAIDDQIMIGVQGYSDQTAVTALIQRYSSYSAVPPDSQLALKTWLMFGLDRGLLAEYRAWSATFLIYQEGLKEGLWNHRQWLDQILAQQTVNQTLPYFTFHYLDPRSQDPTDGLFSNPFIATGLSDLRQELRTSAEPPPLDDLQSILENP